MWSMFSSQLLHTTLNPGNSHGLWFCFLHQAFNPQDYQHNNLMYVLFCVYIIPWNLQKKYSFMIELYGWICPYKPILLIWKKSFAFGSPFIGLPLCAFPTPYGGKTVIWNFAQNLCSQTKAQVGKKGEGQTYRKKWEKNSVRAHRLYQLLPPGLKKFPGEKLFNLLHLLLLLHTVPTSTWNQEVFGAILCDSTWFQIIFKVYKVL